MYDDYITLVKKKPVTNESGSLMETETSRRDVFCRSVSVSMKETYEALAVGSHPEIKIILADYLDYDFERYVVYQGVEFSVTRTYRNGRELELTLERVNDNARS